MPKHIATQVASSLRDRIKSGEWRDSKMLPNERDLAVEYGVARNTMRRAIDSIQREGMVSRHVGRGTLIRAEAGDDLAEIMRRMQNTSPLDVMNVRMMLEPQAAAAAAANGTESDLTGVAEAHRGAAACLDPEQFEHWDAEFHRRIFSSTRNELLASLNDILCVIRNRAPWLEIKRRTFSEERRQAYCEHHATILDALMARDANAAAEHMRAHLNGVARNLFGAGGLLWPPH